MKETGSRERRDKIFVKSMDFSERILYIEGVKGTVNPAPELSGFIERIENLGFIR